MDNSGYRPIPLSRAKIPKDEHLVAEILGVDNASYFHIAFMDQATLANYREMVGKMRQLVDNRCCIPFGWCGPPGTECIVEHVGRRGGIHVRGQVLEVFKDLKRVRVRLVDDFCEVEVHYSTIFHTAASICYFPSFVLKCKLENLDTFLEHSYLKGLYNVYINGIWKPTSSLCTVRIVCNGNVPTVRLTTCNGNDLSDILQQHIPGFMRMEYPAYNIPTKVLISHFDHQGIFWFRLCNDQEQNALSVVEYRLNQCCWSGLKPTVIDQTETLEKSWKNRFVSGANSVFIYNDTDQKKCYRVLQLHKQGKNSQRHQVFYIDYGYTQFVEDDKLYRANMIDENLCFIPPQCLPAKLASTKDCDQDNSSVFVSSNTFWEYVSTQPMFIKLKERLFSPLFPENVQKYSVLPMRFVDGHLNFIPPQCRPIRFIGDNLKAVSQECQFNQFWKLSRHMPVSWICKRFKIPLLEGGQYSGDVLPPEADVLVHVQLSENGGLEERLLSEMIQTLK